MRLSILMTSLLAVGAVALAACGGDSDDTVGAEQTTASAATQVAAQTPAAEKKQRLEDALSATRAALTVGPAAGTADLVELPAHFEGTGPMSTARFSLETGPVNFKIFHDGADEFAVVLLDDAGGLTSNLVGVESLVMGAYDDTKTIHATVGGFAGTPVHFLQITADGNWSIDVSQ